MVSDNKIDRDAKVIRQRGAKLMEARRQAREEQRAQSFTTRVPTQWLMEAVRRLDAVAQNAKNSGCAPRVVFTGPAGCGKATLAQTFADRLAELAVVDVPDMTVVNGRSELVGRYEGQTRANTRSLLRGRRVVLIKDFTGITTRDLLPEMVGFDPYGEEATDAIGEVLDNRQSATVVVLSTRSTLTEAREELRKWASERDIAAPAIDEFIECPGLTATEAADITGRLIDLQDRTTEENRLWSQTHLLTNFLPTEARLADGRRLLDMFENLKLCQRVAAEVGQLGSGRATPEDVDEGFHRATGGLAPYPIGINRGG